MFQNDDGDKARRGNRWLKPLLVLLSLGGAAWLIRRAMTVRELRSSPAAAGAGSSKGPPNPWKKAKDDITFPKPPKIPKNLPKQPNPFDDKKLEDEGREKGRKDPKKLFEKKPRIPNPDAPALPAELKELTDKMKKSRIPKPPAEPPRRATAADQPPREPAAADGEPPAPAPASLKGLKPALGGSLRDLRPSHAHAPPAFESADAPPAAEDAAWEKVPARALARARARRCVCLLRIATLTAWDRRRWLERPPRCRCDTHTHTHWFSPAARAQVEEVLG